MAVTQENKSTTTESDPKPGSAPSAARAGAEGRTITIPSMQSMIPLNDAFEPKHLLWFGGLAGSLIAVSAVRERSLFRYFKDR